MYLSTIKVRSWRPYLEVPVAFAGFPSGYAANTCVYGVREYKCVWCMRIRMYGVWEYKCMHISTCVLTTVMDHDTHVPDKFKHAILLVLRRSGYCSSSPRVPVFSRALFLSLMVSASLAHGMSECMQVSMCLYTCISLDYTTHRHIGYTTHMHTDTGKQTL